MAKVFKVGLIGFLAGLAPDLDVFIGSSTDPILFLEFHRQFTHSLIFIPFGSLLVALLIFPLVKRSMNFKTVYLASLLGYATHGLLDACTSYGTQLFWPFSNERVTWNNISIIDPLFTIPALILLGIAIKSKKKVFKAETSILRLNNHKSKKFINWHPKWTLDKSLSKIVEWNKQIKFKSYLNVCEDQIKDFLKS